MKIESIVNKCFEPVYSTNKRYIDIAGGRGRGGSHFVTQYFLERITMPYYFRGYFIRKTKADIKESLFRDFKDRVAEHPLLTEDDFIFNESNYSVVCKLTGNSIHSKGATANKGRTANMKSIAGATHLAIEEFDELEEDYFDQLDLSLRKEGVQIQIFRIYNQPPVHHWMYRDFNLTEKAVTYPNGKEVKMYLPEPKSESNILYIHTTYHDNVANLNPSTITKFESFKATRPEYYYNQIAGLIGTGSKGQIYSDWKTCTDEEFDHVDDTPVYGLDFGYGNHATALVAVKKVGDTRYYKEILFEKQSMDNIELKRRFNALGLNEDSIIIADGGNGGNIRVAELRREDEIDGKTLLFNVYLANKGPGSVWIGIDKIKNLEQVYVTESSHNMLYEYRNYKWLLNAKKEPTEQPNKDEDVDNTLDAIRYVELTPIYN